MNGLGPIVLGVGTQDGFNPCIFMTCAVFILHGLWFKRTDGGIFWLRLIFVLAYAVSLLAFNFGPAQVFVYYKYCVLVAKILYFILGAGALVLGVLFLKDWISFSRGLITEDWAKTKITPYPGGGFVKGVITILLAVLLAALSTLWPVNMYFMLLGNEAILKGQGQMVISLLVGYVLATMWPLWLVWGFLSIKNLRPSLLMIFAASVFLTATTTMIFIFK